MLQALWRPDMTPDEILRCVTPSGLSHKLLFQLYDDARRRGLTLLARKRANGRGHDRDVNETHPPRPTHSNGDDDGKSR
jgi:hypothetical protein